MLIIEVKSFFASHFFGPFPTMSDAESYIQNGNLGREFPNSEINDDDSIVCYMDRERRISAIIHDLYEPGTKRLPTEQEVEQNMRGSGCKN